MPVRRPRGARPPTPPSPWRGDRWTRCSRSRRRSERPGWAQNSRALNTRSNTRAARGHPLASRSFAIFTRAHPPRRCSEGLTEKDYEETFPCCGTREKGAK
eukprot:1469459-Prymnesium_polylepis.1